MADEYFPKRYVPFFVLMIIASVLYAGLGVYYIIQIAQGNDTDENTPSYTNWISLITCLVVCAFGIFAALAVSSILLLVFLMFNICMFIIAIAQIIFFAVIITQCNGDKGKEEEGFWGYMCDHSPPDSYIPLGIQAGVSAFCSVVSFLARAVAKKKEEVKKFEGDFF